MFTVDVKQQCNNNNKNLYNLKYSNGMKMNFHLITMDYTEKNVTVLNGLLPGVKKERVGRIVYIERRLCSFAETYRRQCRAVGRAPE